MLKKGSSRKGERRRKSIKANPNSEESTRAANEPEKSDTKSAVSIVEISSAAILLEVAEVGIADPYRGTAAGYQPCPEEHKVPPRELESRWGDKNFQRKNVRFTWIGVGAVAVLFLTALAVVNYFSMQENHNPQDRMSGFVVDSKGFDVDSSQFVFQQDPQRYLTECLAVLKKFTNAQNVAEVIPLIRNNDKSLVKMITRWRPWLSPPKILTELDYDYEFGVSGGTEFIAIHGINDNDTPFIAYFAYANDAMVLDWAASAGLGETSLSTLARNPTKQPVTMRVILSSSPYYLPTLPESDYESSKITCLNDEAIVWGYVKRNTDAHRKIKALLHTDGDLLDRIAEARAIVNLKRTDDISSKNRFFITEMLHNDWVMP